MILQVPVQPGGNRHAGVAADDDLPLGAFDLEDILGSIKKLVEDETAGNPSSDDRWVNRTSRKLAAAMGKLGHDISHVTMIRLLKKLD